MTISVEAEPLTAARFAPFGQVIEVGGAADAMNSGRFDRFDDLCEIDTDGQTAVGIVRCRTATRLPYRVDLVERHPLGSQAFLPLDGQQFVVAVAEPGGPPDLVAAFITNGHQGVNYRRGAWHMPLIAFAPGQRFLVIDRCTDEPNCDTHQLAAPVLLDAAS